MSTVKAVDVDNRNGEGRVKNLADFDDFQDDNSEFDWGEPGNRPFNATELQVRFAKAKLTGCSHVQAAKKAGYSGDDASLRAQGSRAAASGTVKALIAAASQNGKDEEIEIGDSDELVRLLWKEARQNTNRSSAVRAMELLSKHGWLKSPIDATTIGKLSDRDLLSAAGAISSDPVWHALLGLMALRHFPRDSFDQGPAVDGYTMPASAWAGLEKEFPALARELSALGLAPGKANGVDNPIQAR